MFIPFSRLACAVSLVCAGAVVADRSNVQLVSPSFAQSSEDSEQSNLQPTPAEILQLPNEETRINLWRESFAEISLTEDRLLMLKREAEVLTVQLIDGDTDPMLYNGETVTLPERAVEIRVIDINFDGQQDLLIETAIGYAGVNVFYEAQLAFEQGFVVEPALADIANPEIDPVLKQIRASQRSGPSWFTTVYELEDGRLYKDHETTAAGDTIEFAQFFNPDGSLKSEMITDALADDPRDWRPLEIELPEDSLFPLYAEPDASSNAADEIEPGRNVLLRRLSADRLFVLIEDADNGTQGWVKTEWLQLPPGYSLY